LSTNLNPEAIDFYIKLFDLDYDWPFGNVYEGLPSNPALFTLDYKAMGAAKLQSIEAELGSARRKE